MACVIARNMDAARGRRDCTEREENEAKKHKNRRTRRTDSHGNVWSKIAFSVHSEVFEAHLCEVIGVDGLMGPSGAVTLR